MTFEFRPEQHYHPAVPNGGHLLHFILCGVGELHSESAAICGYRPSSPNSVIAPRHGWYEREIRDWSQVDRVCAKCRSRLPTGHALRKHESARGRVSEIASAPAAVQVGQRYRDRRSPSRVGFVEQIYTNGTARLYWARSGRSSCVKLDRLATDYVLLVEGESWTLRPDTEGGTA